MIVPGAVTVNLAVDLRARATCVARGDGKVRIVSKDRKRSVTRRRPLSPDGATGALSLLERIVGSFAPRRGLELTTAAEAPAGAGLGGSSTLAVAVGAALAAWTGESLGRVRLLRRVMNLETAELAVPTGEQDYLAAIHGGLSAYHHEPDGTRREKLPLPEGLGERYVLAYTGQPRHSGMSNWEMFRRFVDRDRRTVGHMREIARIAAELAQALREADLDAAGKLVGEEGRLRYRLAPSVATPALLEADRAARRAGALGAKVCGAGGGGCMVAFVREGRREAVAAAIEATGARVLNAPVARRGLAVERSKGVSGSRSGS